jgi:nucleoside recognition membrane protein YjiH
MCLLTYEWLCDLRPTEEATATWRTALLLSMPHTLLVSGVVVLITQGLGYKELWRYAFPLMAIAGVVYVWKVDSMLGRAVVEPRHTSELGHFEYIQRRQRRPLLFLYFGFCVLVMFVAGVSLWPHPALRSR